MQFGLNHDHNMQSPDCKSTGENSSPIVLRESMNQPSLHYILDNSLVWLHLVSLFQLMMVSTLGSNVTSVMTSNSSVILT
jgi:hypothetical protein